MRRVMGDPGKAEIFQVPHYLYLFVMKEVGNAWQIWRMEERVLEDEDWVASRYGGELMNKKDNIYLYKEPIHFILKNETPQGRVYAVCSRCKLTFNKSMANISGMDDLLNWQFNTAPDSIQESLQNIYTTPYNYNRSGRYYCSFDCSSGASASVDLLLYHVAAKVDIKWNVVDSMRINKTDASKAVRLTYMEAKNLYNGWAYCFKPMRNTMANLPTSGGYAIEDIVTPTDEGLWWEGRDYFYTIPYTVTNDPDYFPLQMKMGTNGTKATAEYEPTLKLEIDTSAVFVPWLRANFNISAPLPNDSPTKIVNN